MQKWIAVAAIRLGLLAALSLGAERAAAQAPASAPRQYAPSREADLLHLALDVTPDFRQRSLTAQATVRFKPIALPLAELRLDAVDLNVTNLTATWKVLGWQATGERIIVTFDPPIPPDREVSVVIGYQARPTEGLYFRTAELGYPPGEEHLWSQGEAVSARHWYPGMDSPNEKYTTEITCRVPEGMVVLSNGRKVSEERSGGLVAVRWLQDKPHVNYLLALVAGRFEKLQDRHGDIPLAFWTLPSDSPQAASTFDGTRDMMAFFERETGVPYPWARYDQVCVADFVVGGMENTTLTVLNNQTLFRPETGNLRNSQGLVAHELAHQWFGNLVTCKDWSHLWLNEGFATYYEHLYDEHRNGRDEFLYRLWLGAADLTGQLNDTRPVVWRGYASPNDMFDWRAYGKGGWILHMLREQLGPELFRRCIRTYLERHQFDCVVTEDLNRVLEELSGRSFDRFFDQWLHHPGTPTLDVDYAWDERSKAARLTVRQTPPGGDKGILFELPLTVRFDSAAGPIERRLVVKERSEDFHFNLPQMPEVVRVDPRVAVLAKIRFRPPRAMVEAQLANRSDVVGRLLAVDQLELARDNQAVARLKRVLNEDAFYGVRVAAAGALRGIHTPEALDALLGSFPQADARVRRAVVAEVGRFHGDKSVAALRGLLEKEANPDIRAEAVQALGAYPETRELLLDELRADSYGDIRALASIRALRQLQDPSCAPELWKVLQRSSPPLQRQATVEGLDALAWLARGQTNAEAARRLIVQRTSDPAQAVQIAAIKALGTLEDPRALPVLNTFAFAAKDSPQRKAAEGAIEALRSARKAPVELGELRREIAELQRQNLQFKKDLADLQQKLAGLSPTNPPPAAKPRFKGR